MSQIVLFPSNGPLSQIPAYIHAHVLYLSTLFFACRVVGTEVGSSSHETNVTIVIH
jgi:hypothetical protein